MNRPRLTVPGISAQRVFTLLWVDGVIARTGRRWRDIVFGIQRRDREMVLVLESIDAALLSIRLDGDITAWDRRAELLCGWSASEVLGKSLADTVIAPDYRGAFKMNLAEYRSGHESALVGRRIAIFALHRDGHPIPVELGLWSQGSGRGFSALMHDISDRLDTHSKKAAAQ